MLTSSPFSEAFLEALSSSLRSSYETVADLSDEDAERLYELMKEYGDV